MPTSAGWWTRWHGWTERRPHLVGALGTAVWARVISAGWVLREPGSRVVRVTEAGRVALGNYLGVAV